jgi:hypothetical protein
MSSKESCYSLIIYTFNFSRYSLGDETVSSSPIPLKKFVYQYPINQKQVHGKLARV